MLRLVSKRILGVLPEVRSPTLQVLPQCSLEKVVDPCNNPRHVRSKYDPMVGMGLVGAPACGDGIKIHIKDVVSSSMGKLQGINHFVHLSFMTACLLRMPSKQVLKVMKLSEPCQLLLRQHLERRPPPPQGPQLWLKRDFARYLLIFLL